MENDFIKELGFLGFATRLKRLGDFFMQEGRRLYQGLDIDIEPNWYLIFKILDKHKKLSITEIANRLQLSHPSIITITLKMERAGYIQSVKSSTDNRKRVLSLSQKAIDKMPEYEKIWQAGTKGMEEALAGLDALAFMDLFEERFKAKHFEERTLEQLKLKTAV